MLCDPVVCRLPARLGSQMLSVLFRLCGGAGVLVLHGPTGYKTGQQNLPSARLCVSISLCVCVCVSCRATSCSSCQRNRRHIPSQLTSPSPSSSLSPSSVARRGRIYKFLRIFISVSIFCCCCCVFPSRVHSSYNCFGFVYHLNIKAKCEDDSFRCLPHTPSHLLLPL